MQHACLSAPIDQMLSEKRRKNEPTNVPECPVVSPGVSKFGGRFDVSASPHPLKNLGFSEAAESGMFQGVPPRSKDQKNRKRTQTVLANPRSQDVFKSPR